MKQPYNHGVLFYHEHSGLKDIHNGIGEVAKSLSSMCKHLFNSVKIKAILLNIVNLLKMKIIALM